MRRLNLRYANLLLGQAVPDDKDLRVIAETRSDKSRERKLRVGVNAGSFDMSEPAAGHGGEAIR
jgi:hypothetical protein